MGARCLKRCLGGRVSPVENSPDLTSNESREFSTGETRPRFTACRVCSASTSVRVQSRNRPRRVAARVALRLGRALQPDLRGFLLHERFPATRTGPFAPTLARAAGEHPFTWDGRTGTGEQAADGVYFYRAVINGHAQTRRMVLLRAR